MNRFDEELRQAARRKRNTVAIASLVFVTFGLVLAGYFLSFRSLSIEVRPEQARQSSVISITDGLALSFANRIYALSDTARLSISEAKYQTAELTISDTDFGTNMTVILLPKPGMLRAAVTPSTPVNWYLNGQFVSQSSTLDTELAPGDYQLAVTSDYHEKVERNVTISAAQDTALSINIPVITGILRAAMTPPGEIRVDGVPVDNAAAITLGPGRHQIEVSAAGHQPVTDEIIVTQAQREFTRAYNLQPQPVRIRHQLAPAAGSLFVNGKQLDISQYVISVPYRQSIDIEYSKPGFTTQRQSLAVSPGETVTVALTLPPEFVDISVTANVTAEVYLDGQAFGPTPLQLSVPTLPATLELRADGYQSATKSIAPKMGQPQTHDFSLITTAVAKLRKAPRIYTNSSGIELQLVQPENAQFQMGGNVLKLASGPMNLSAH